MEPDGWLSVVWVGFLGLRAPVPATKSQAEKERREKEGNGDARSSRESQEIQGRKPGGSATDGRCIYIRGPVPGKGRPEEEAEREWSRTVVCSLGWLLGLRAGSATDGPCIYIRGPVPGKGRPERKQRENGAGRLSVVWVGFLGLRAPVLARGPQAEKERREKEGNGDARSSRERQGIQGRKPGGSATDGRCVYIRGPVPGKGRPEEEAEREWSRTVGCL